MYTVTTVAGENDRMISIERRSYMIRAERRSDGTLRFPTRTVDGQRVLNYVIETRPISIGGSGAAAPTEDPKEGTKGETKAEAVEAVATKG